MPSPRPTIASRPGLSEPSNQAASQKKIVVASPYPSALSSSA
jgi:hypothetical protein